MENKKKRTKLLTAIIVLIIIGGFWGIVRSFPFFTLSTAIKQRGITISNKVNIQQIKPNTPAADAQLMQGDIIISINGEKISTSSDVVNKSNESPGKAITLVVERNGKLTPIQLIPRINPPPNEGRLGVVLANTIIQKKPIIELIPEVIFRSYAGYEERPVTIFSTQVYGDKSFTRLRSLIWGIIAIVIGWGLWKWKKWAYYSYLFYTASIVVLALPYFINPTHYSISPRKLSFFPLIQKTPTLTDTIFLGSSLIIEVLFAFYVLKKKNYFLNK